MSQKLRGFVGQTMSGSRRPFTGYTYQYPPGTYTFTAPKAGRWKFVLWGPGGNGASNNDGGSGAYCEYTRFLAVGETVALSVSVYGAATTATFVGGGKVVSAGQGQDGQGGGPGAGGTATGGDVNLSGSSGTAAGLGTGGGAAGASGAPGAPANLPFRGGHGGASSADTNAKNAEAPGGGGAPLASGVGTVAGGAGLALVLLARQQQ